MYAVHSASSLPRCRDLICVSVLTDHWEEQPTIKRLAALLTKREYKVWFGAHAAVTRYRFVLLSSSAVRVADLERVKASGPGSIVDA